MKYYKVCAKCGHVGRSYYYKGEFFEKALSAKDAAAKVRQRPRVKHHHKDAILSVEKVSYEDYISYISHPEEKYFTCYTIQDQHLYWDQIKTKVFLESCSSEKQYKHKNNKSTLYFKQKKYSMIEKENQNMIDYYKNVI